LNFRRVVALSVALVILLGVGGGAYWYFSRPAAAKAKQCEAIRDAVKARGEMVNVSFGAKPLAIIGDSYSAGDELDDRTAGWVYGLRNAVSGGIVVDGIGGTGFVNGGYCGTGAYDSRIQSILDLKPSTVIIQGGLNDVTAEGRDVEFAASIVLGRASMVERVVVVGPVDAPGRENEAVVDAQLRKATEAAGREYVSALRWNLEFQPDKTHLTPAGHATFAANVASALGS